WDVDQSWDRRHVLQDDGMVCVDRRSGSRREFQSLNVAPDDDGLDGAVEVDADGCEETGAGCRVALGAGACGDNTSGSESVSMLSHFE
ncbi:hypothetical protein NW759_017554, partial [Fusarium solani]